MNSQKSSPPSEPKKRHKGLIITLSCLLGLFGCFMLVAGFLVQYYFGGLKTESLTTDYSELGITDTAPQDKKIVNIALYGVDSVGEKIYGRSDAIMVLSVDNRHGKLKLTSILRDSYVQIEGYGNDKITHAFVFGGAPLAIRTLNQNFNLDIKEYVAVNFNSLAKVIDAMNGVDMVITEAERVEINRIMATSHYGVKWNRVTSSGLVHLDGIQAMSYARIRGIDNDIKRSHRQQDVLKALFEKMQKMKKSEYPDFIRQMIGLVETSLSYNDILSLSAIMFSPNLEVVTNTIPLQEDDLTSGFKDKVWYWFYDLDLATDRLHKFIYDDVYDVTSQS